MSNTITTWTETLMLDSFGDLTETQFDLAADAYELAIRTAYPDADVDITIERAVGCQVGINEIEWADGDVTLPADYSADFFTAAINAALRA